MKNVQRQNCPINDAEDEQHNAENVGPECPKRVSWTWQNYVKNQINVTINVKLRIQITSINDMWWNQRTWGQLEIIQAETHKGASPSTDGTEEHNGKHNRDGNHRQRRKLLLDNNRPGDNNRLILFIIIWNIKIINVYSDHWTNDEQIRCRNSPMSNCNQQQQHVTKHNQTGNTWQNIKLNKFANKCAPLNVNKFTVFL